MTIKSNSGGEAFRLLARATVICCVTILGLAGSPTAAEWEAGGYAAAEVRLFPNAPAFAAQSDQRFSPALTLQPELRMNAENDRDQFVVIPYLKIDQNDNRRTHGDLREFYWQREDNNWALLVGMNKVFWGVMESRHVVDIVNQTDLVVSPFGEEKLGQGMINARYYADLGTIDAFLLLGFRDRTFPDDDARLRGAFPIDIDAPVFESGQRRRHVDWALRWSRAIGNWDIGVSHFRGTGREPRLVLGVDDSGNAQLVPHYDLINQTGLDLQYTLNAWNWKLEAFSRNGQGNRFSALAAGFEYSLFDLAGSGADLGLLAEYLYDGRDASAPATRFDEDVFAGFRLALNDAAGTEITGGAIVDLHTRELSFSIEAGLRIDDRWRIDVEGMAFHRIPEGSVLGGFRRDDYLGLQLSRYF